MGSCQLSVVSAMTVFQLVGEDDLRDVRSAVADLAGRWEDLGISLGVRPGDLDAILSASAHSPSSCLREMLLLWLRQSYNVSTPLQINPLVNLCVNSMLICPVACINWFDHLSMEAVDA